MSNTTTSKRIFKFNGTNLPDIEGLSPDGVRKAHAASNPALTNAHVTGPDYDGNGDAVYVIKSSELGTKG